MAEIEQIKQKSKSLKSLAKKFLIESAKVNYSYEFKWLSRPIIQYPQDIVAIQEIIWRVKPDLIIETGIAHGGSLVFSASILALLEYSEALTLGHTLDPQKPKRKVIGVDIDIRGHNRTELDAHSMRNRLHLIEGSSVSPAVIEEVNVLAQGYSRIMVFLDSNHTHEHVYAELEAYAPLVSPGSYCVVFDTVIDDLESPPDRSWGPNNSPKSAVHDYLKIDSAFKVDKAIEDKLLITVAPDGYLLKK